MATQAFYTVRQGGQPMPARPAAGGRPPNMPPPPPPAPGQGHGGMPGGMPGGPRPQLQPIIQTVHPQGAPAMGIPPPARNMAPAQFNQRPLVEISDIRYESLTDDDLREQISDYFVYRFEKVPGQSGYDSDGGKVRSSWENCTRTAVPGVSNKEAARQVRHLKKDSQTVADKKRSLNLAQQRQIEKALHDLSTAETDQRFQVVLAQIDHQLKPISKDIRVYSKKGVYKTKGKKQFERISITAYYKRCPRPDQNPRLLGRQLQLEMQVAEEQRRMHFFHQAGMNHPGPQGPPRPMPQQMPQQMPPQHMPPRPMHPQHQGPQGPQGQQGHQGHHGNPNIQVVNGGRHERHYDDSRSGSSGESSWPSEESGSDSETDVTPPSSLSSKHDNRRNRRGPRRYVEEGPGHFGVRKNLPTRRHSVHDDEAIYVLSSSAPRPPLPPPPPRASGALVQDVLDEVRVNSAYEQGRADQTAELRRELRLGEDRRLAEELALSRPYQARRAPSPHILQRRRSMRHVAPSELEYQRDEEDLARFGRLRMDDRFEDDLFREDARRRADMRRRLEEEDALAYEEEDRRERERVLRAEDYIRRTGSVSSGDASFTDHNPFSPLPRRRVSPVSPISPRRYYRD